MADWLSTLAGLLLFSLCRYLFLPEIPRTYGGFLPFLQSGGVVRTLLLFPLLMLMVNYLTGYYMRVSSKSRVDELLRTVCSVSIATLIYFFVVLLNDFQPMRRLHYEVMLLFAGSLFITIWPVRFAITTIIKSRAERRPPRKFILITAPGDESPLSPALAEACRCTGVEITEVCPLGTEIHKGETEGVVIAPSALKATDMQRAIHNLFSLEIPVLVSPDDRSALLGTVTRFDHVKGDPLVDITAPYLSDSVLAIKRFTDVVVSAIGLVVCSPLILALAIAVRIQSPGPAFYSQERIGYHRRPFMIHKLRSMVAESETAGPQLSSDADPRITPIGRFMRKYRLDELPNLWNVFVGEMSLVGPRPEREYFIRRIIEKAPHYTLLHLVRPGLTSWGMVRYGYASDVDQMVERLRYDILYIQNLTLEVDLKIALHTLRTLLRGEGK